MAFLQLVPEQVHSVNEIVHGGYRGHEDHLRCGRLGEQFHSLLPITLHEGLEEDEEVPHVPEQIILVPKEFKGSFVKVPNGELQGKTFSPDALELVEDS